MKFILNVVAGSLFTFAGIVIMEKAVRYDINGSNWLPAVASLVVIGYGLHLFAEAHS